MPRIVRSARGEAVDFDVILIKNQLAQAPQNIEVQRRQNFIDNKETSERKRVIEKPAVWIPQPDQIQTPQPAVAESFDEMGDMPVSKVEPPAPPTIKRK